MGRFAPQYAPEQKQGCAEAVVDGDRLYGRKLYPKDAVRMAAAGELHNLEPFEITLSAVQKAAGKMRRERTGREIKLRRERGTVEQRIEALTAQRLRILEHAQDRLERKEQRTGLSGQEMMDLKNCGLVEREIRARAQPPASNTGQKARQEKRDEPPATTGKSDLVRNLERDLRNQNGEKGGPAHVPEVETVGSAAPA